MLGTTYTDLRTGSSLARALFSGEITVSEFAEAARFLEPEAAQVLGTALHESAEHFSQDRLWRARWICAKVAARNRNLS